LVLELKTHHEDQGSNGGSVQSIVEVQQQFGYQHAVLLDLRLAREVGPDPHWTWVDPETAGARETARVYRKPGALAALTGRGQEEAHRRYR
jgi:hypothetical protein